MKIAIVGSRRYPNLEQVRMFVNALPLNAVVVSGGAVGVDTVAEGEAAMRGMATIRVVPDWEGRGKRAGFERNGEIVAMADRVVAFWDGGSRGTYDTILKALKARKPLQVFFPGRCQTCGREFDDPLECLNLERVRFAVLK